LKIAGIPLDTAWYYIREYTEVIKGVACDETARKGRCCAHNNSAIEG
jgi:hypothetical protein